MDSVVPQSLPEKEKVATQPGWSADVADLFVLLCSFLLTSASIVLIALVFHTQTAYTRAPPLDPPPQAVVPHDALEIGQRAIASLSVTVTSALIIVVGRRYVLFKLTRGGMRGRRVALYSHLSIGTIVQYLLRRGIELPLLAFLAVWALGLATGLTVNDTWTMEPFVESLAVWAPISPLDGPEPTGGVLAQASQQLTFIMTSMCSGVQVADATGMINITGVNRQLVTGGPAGFLVYPPLPDLMPNTVFSVQSAQLNGFNTSMEPLSSIPPTAQALICLNGTTNTGPQYSTGAFWYAGGDTQTLSIIVANPNPSVFPNPSSLYRLNASAIVFGGVLQSTGKATEFIFNGTTWPNVMSNDQWALDIASLVCNTTFSAVGTFCVGSTLFDFAGVLDGLTGYMENTIYMTNPPYPPALLGRYWDTTLGMAMGAYSSAMWYVKPKTTFPDTLVKDYNYVSFAPHYGIYVLIANVIASTLMLVTFVRLRFPSRLGADFIDSTRLLLNPLTNPALFNASLDTTVHTALADPCMLVKDDNEFLLSKQTLEKSKRRSDTE